jgi:hypothetical protein
MIDKDRDEGKMQGMNPGPCSRGMLIPAVHGPEQAAEASGANSPNVPAGHARHWKRASMYCPVAHAVVV